MNIAGSRQVTFRVDASTAIGTGHVMRCLALASSLRTAGYDCHFICREHLGHLGARIVWEGHKLSLLPAGISVGSGAQAALPGFSNWLGCDWQSDARQTVSALGPAVTDWLVVDHYAIDFRWERELRPHCANLMVVDDLADRIHDCDLLLDQTPGRILAEYLGLGSPGMLALIGPAYALMRPEFLRCRADSLGRRGQPGVHRILVSMGGVDQPNATAAVLRALRTCHLPDHCLVTVVMGAGAPWLVEVQALAEGFSGRCEVQVDVLDMALLALDCDLAIGAPGVASLERCCLGLPSILVVLAENQRSGGVALREAGAADLLESVDAIESGLAPILMSYFEGNRGLQVSMAARSIVDGLGVDRVVSEMESAG